MSPLLHFASLTVKAASSELMQMLEGRDDCRLMMTFACRRSPTHIAMNDVTPAAPSATKKSRPNAVMVAVIYCSVTQVALPNLAVLPEFHLR